MESTMFHVDTCCNLRCIVILVLTFTSMDTVKPCRSNCQQVCHKKLDQIKNLFQILVSDKLSTNIYVISTCIAESMAFNGSFNCGM